MFATLFKKPKWQSKDVNKRLIAIDQDLTPINAQDSQVLHELLEHDPSDAVKQAALLKLNDLDTFIDFSCSSSPVMRSFAVKQLQVMIAEHHQLKLSEEQKRRLLEKDFNKAFYEQWLKTESSPRFVKLLLSKIDKPSLLPVVFKQASSDLQLALIEDIEDIALLEKLQKFAINNVKSIVMQKRERLINVAEKPEKLYKALQLELAKLLALNEVSEYPSYLNKRAEIDNNWQNLVEDIELLSINVKAATLARYDEIAQHLDNVFSEKAREYHAQQKALALEEKKRLAQQEIRVQLKSIEQQMTNAIFNNEALDNSVVNLQLAKLNADIIESPLTTNEKRDFETLSQSLADKLSKLPEIAELVTQATHLISKAAQIKLPDTLDNLNEQLALFEQWHQQWLNVKRDSHGVLPDSIVNAYQDIVAQWQQTVEPLQSEQTTQFKQVRRQLNDIKRLIAQGKYNPVFGIFKKATRAFATLSPGQQTKLSKDHDFAKEKLAELTDWENYIVTPRKQELLANIQQLVQSPRSDAMEQANLVKQYRAKWNQLGHAEQAIDKSLNEQFNQACEQAFAPCREFYLKKEKLRERHITNREQIIAKAREFTDANELDAIHQKNIETALNQFKQQWRNAGQVDKENYQALNKTFITAISPLESFIKQCYKENAEQKSDLITQAKALVNEDNQRAVNLVKKLQQQWNLIGYSSSHKENALWQDFRAVCDQIFAMRDRHRDETKLQQKALLDQISTEIDALVQQADKESVKDIEQRHNQLKQLKKDIICQGIQVKTLENKISKAKAFFEQLAIEQRAKQNNQQLMLVGQILDSLIDQPVEEITIISTLTAPWKKCFTYYQESLAANTLRREELMITLEILSTLESPEKDKNKRLAIQVNLMQAQLTEGKKHDVMSVFADWLAQGSLKDIDKQAIARVKKALQTSQIVNQ